MKTNKFILISALLLIIHLAASLPFAVDALADVDGTVINVSGGPIEGALVDILSPLELNDITDENGNYFIGDVPKGEYDIVASKDGFEPSTQKFEIDDEVVTVNFILYPAGTECKPDCSKTSDEKPVCHMDCDGINGCNFSDVVIRNKCTRDGMEGWGIPVGNTVSYNKTHKATCCEGEPYLYKRIKGTSIKLPKSENIIRITRIVFFRGQFARMIIDMFY